MKKFSLLVVLCLFSISLIFLFHIITIYFSFIAPINLVATSRASSTQGTLSFSVESGTSCGDNSCNGGETCSTCSADCGSCSSGGSSGGGGGGGGSSYTPRETEVIDIYTLTPTEFNIFMVAGNPISKEIKVRNIGNESVDIDVGSAGINEFVSFSQNKFSLRPGEETLVFFHLLIPKSGVYAGKITFQSAGGVSKDVFVVANVQGGSPLFDVSLTIPSAYKIIDVGQKVKSLLTLTQIGEPENLDVTIKYLVKDFDGNTLITESETVAIIGGDSFSKEIDSSKLDSGEYVLGVEVLYPLGVATSSDSFTVVEKEFNLIYIFIALLIIAILVILYSIYRYKKSGSYKKR